MDVLLNRTAAFLFSCAFYSKERTAAQPGSAKGPRIYSDSPRLPRTASEERFRLILDGNDASPLQAAGPKPNGALWWGHQQGSLESWPLPSGSASQHSLQGLPSQSLGWGMAGGPKAARHPHFFGLAPRVSPDLTPLRHALGPSPRGRL